MPTALTFISIHEPGVPPAPHGPFHRHGISMNPSGGDQPLVEIDNLSKRYGDFDAVSQFSLTVGAGELFALLGPNGAGKTTTIRMLMGILQPSAGLRPHRRPQLLHRPRRGHAPRRLPPG